LPLDNPIDCNLCPGLCFGQNEGVDEITSISAPRPCQFQNGNDVLTFYSFEKDDLVFDVCIFVAIMAVMRVLGFLFLYGRAYRK